jgi:hypothetical protein
VQPYTKFLDAGVTPAATSTGFKSVAPSSIAWPGGLMWLAVVAIGGGCSLRAVTGFGEPWVMFDVGQLPTTLTYRSWTSPIGEGALPTTLPTVLNLAGDGNPKIAFKTA